MTATRTPDTIGVRRWGILAVGVGAQATTCSFLYGLVFLIPQLQADEAVSLAGAGFLVTSPILGLMLTLIAWGAAADRYGERVVMTIGMAATGLVLLGSLALPGLAALGGGLAVAGACGASVNAASGRVVLGWFTAKERGLAMGIRQTAQPLGVGLASATLPAIGQHWGFRAALVLPAVLCLVAAVLIVIVVIDPPRPARRTVAQTRSPYRFPTLWRLHAASALLVGPQFVAATFALTYLVSRQHWDPVTAGQFVAVVQLAGAGGRIAVGVWSDRVGSRMRPMRWIALVAMSTMLLWAAGDLSWPWLAVAALVAALIVTVTDNGLAFTATAEMAGPFWAGRALGMQNTSQNGVALLIAPAFGWLISGTSYPAALLVAAILPAVGAVLTPVRGETLEPLGSREPLANAENRK